MNYSIERRKVPAEFFDKFHFILFSIMLKMTGNGKNRNRNLQTPFGARVVRGTGGVLGYNT